ncbi:MAG: GNAT family N-acetyltransferase [Dermatophilaceae bacterium]
MCDDSGTAHGATAQCVRIRPKEPGDAESVARYLRQAWGGPIVVSHGQAYDCATLPALLAESGADLVGLVTYVIADDALEIVTINASRRAGGVGSALLAAAEGVARDLRLRRLWLITTNDNLDALRFYQRRGMRMVEVLVGAMDLSRDTKRRMGAGDVPLIGHYGIESRDEIALERQLPVPT